MIYFVGSSFAPTHLREAARKRGIHSAARLKDANLVFISEDTPTNEAGERNLARIEALVRETSAHTNGILVLTSQVTPGFTRKLGLPIYHQAETLRVKDAIERAMFPEQHIVGCADPEATLPEVYMQYLKTFYAPIHKVTWEEAEFAKIAINMTLAAQVENANRLSFAAAKICVKWENIEKILGCDRRIGPHSYLTPGRWQDSKHLLRDYVTLREIEDG
jgi:UDPglucose 6-dehydrogenase